MPSKTNNSLSVKAVIMKKMKTSQVNKNLKEKKKSELLKRKQEREAKKEAENKIKERLIAKVEDRPCIWDLSDRGHSNKMTVSQAWSEISLAMELPVEKLKVMWKLLADRARGIFRDKGHSGDGYDEYKEGEKQWRFYRSLLFLRKSYRFRETQTNFENEDEIHFSVENEMDQADENDHCQNDGNDGMVPPNSAPMDTSSVSSRTASMAVKFQRGKRKGSPQMMEEILKTQLASINDVLTKPTEKVVVPQFAAYLAEFLGSIAPERKKRCELAILSLAKVYDDGNEDLMDSLEDNLSRR